MSIKTDYIRAFQTEFKRRLSDGYDIRIMKSHQHARRRSPKAHQAIMAYQEATELSTVRLPKGITTDQEKLGKDILDTIAELPERIQAFNCFEAALERERTKRVKAFDDFEAALRRE